MLCSDPSWLACLSKPPHPPRRLAECQSAATSPRRGEVGAIAEKVSYARSQNQHLSPSGRGRGASPRVRGRGCTTPVSKDSNTSQEAYPACRQRQWHTEL